MKALGIDPIHDTRETFRALVDAMSRPGTVRTGPAPMDHAVASTLLDHEVELATADRELREALEAAGRLTGADPANADVVHVTGEAGDAGERIRAAPRGTLKEPSDGATALCRVDGLDADASTDDDPVSDARAVDYNALRVSGPGVPDTRALGVAGLSADAADAIVDARSGYPRGVDVVLATERRVAALPRSVDLEVV